MLAYILRRILAAMPVMGMVALLRNVIVALVIPQTLRVVRHLLPNTLVPLIVQGAYVMASAVLIEAGLSFLGAGTPPEIPSWGNIMAEARSYTKGGGNWNLRICCG